MTSRGFTNGPNAENEPAQTARRPKRRRYGNRMMGAFENAGRVPSRHGVGSQPWRHIDRTSLPLTALQAETLEALTDAPAPVRVVASRCSLSRKQVSQAVFGLSGKGLAVRTGDGWRRA